jgi:hypothetical protein
MSKTLETFVGPAIMVFHIPFSIGTFKAFVTTTPVEGGSIMRVRTYIDNRVRRSFWKRIIAFLLTGISASQLISDIDILCNKIRVIIKIYTYIYIYIFHIFIFLNFHIYSLKNSERSQCCNRLMVLIIV